MIREGVDEGQNRTDGKRRSTIEQRTRYTTQTERDNRIGGVPEIYFVYRAFDEVNKAKKRVWHIC